MLANHTLEFTTKTRQETLSSVFSAHYYMCLLKKNATFWNLLRENNWCIFRGEVFLAKQV